MVYLSINNVTANTLVPYNCLKNIICCYLYKLIYIGLYYVAVFVKINTHTHKKNQHTTHIHTSKDHS